jgi:nucleoside-diphosphate-sugar epimerase
METMMQTAAQIVAAMLEAVPPGRQSLTDAESRGLARMTRALLASKPEARGEYARFLAAATKDIDLPDAPLAACLQGKRILVTGGTGCVGSALMAQLARFHPARLTSVSRGRTQGWPRLPGAGYLRADIRDPEKLAAVFGQDRYDIVFHLAGQREPGLAERDVHHTVTTNVLGTDNVLSAVAASGVPQVVFASTGKALRPYSAEVYTASKRIAEWLMWRAANSGQASCSATRFTHVVDNSILHRRLLDWCDRGVIRLHDPDAGFYVQSALQSAKLLLTAAACPRRGSLRIHAISDLGWPVSLLDMALGALAQNGSAAPVYFSGYDRGYEAVPFPGLYDPVTAPDVSPLISAFEAPDAERSWSSAVDVFPLEVASASALEERMQALTAICARTEEPGPVRAALDELSWSLFEASMGAVPRQVLARVIQVCRRERLSTEHARMLAAIERHTVESLEPVTG